MFSETCFISLFETIFVFMLFALMLFGNSPIFFTSCLCFRWWRWGGWFFQLFLFTNPGILIDGDWTTTFDWLGIPFCSECSIKAYLVPRMSDDHFLVFNSEFENKILNTIFHVLECNHYIVEKKIQNFTSLFETNVKTETSKPNKRKMIITDSGGNIVIWIGE